MGKKVSITKTVLFVLAVVFFAGTVTGFMLTTDSEFFFKINKSIDIFGRVYKEVASNYVDTVDPEKFMRAGIDGMLEALDPYTVFIDEMESEEVELITTGKYGGIGVTIGMRDGFITVISVMKGYSAEKQGLEVGDRIIEIDGKSTTGIKPLDVRFLVRGTPGTEVHMKIDREGEALPLEFVLIREEIQVKNISYSDYLRDGIAYIKFDRFSRRAGDELRMAIKRLKLTGTIRGVILDLRDNPGGLLDVAVDVVDKFVPKGNLVVSTRGRTPDSEKSYHASEEPMLGDVPLVVIVNRKSASASEIVAGAVQDLDRGLIVGTRTFGKGLVQTITPLGYNTQLKITTAKYYTPSGRSIQEIDYLHKNDGGVFFPISDTLKRTYKTKNGRSVYEAGGIMPDTVVDEQRRSKLYEELLRKAMFFKFATHYYSSHREMPDEVAITDDILREFRKYVSDHQFTYQDGLEVKLTELKKLVQDSKYSTAIERGIEDVSTQIEVEKLHAFEQSREEILQRLEAEIIARYQGEEGRIRSTFPYDQPLQTALYLLEQPARYQRYLRAN
ncbi:MAG: S41 family peptidase [Bacteroidota bacterium]